MAARCWEYMAGWAIAFGLMGAAVAWVTRGQLAYSLAGQLMALAVTGLAMVVAALAVRLGPSVKARPWVWPAALAGIGIAAVGVNLYLDTAVWAPAMYATVELRPGEHPLAVEKHIEAHGAALVHFVWSVPLVGVLCGLAIAGFRTAGRNMTRARRFVAIAGAAATWCVAFVIGGIVGFLGYYFGRAAGPDAFEALHLAAVPGTLLGACLGGAVGGGLCGLVGWLSPDRWLRPTPHASGTLR